MSKKQIVFDKDVREKVLTGITILAKSVGSTLGPSGKCVAIQNQYGSPTITKDGVTVAKSISVEDPFEDLGIQLVKEVASQTADVAGDGTTTATILVESLYKEGLKFITAGYDAQQLKREIDAAVQFVLGKVKEQSKPVTTSEEIQQVATISANGDKEIGKLLAEAFEKVGPDGMVTVEHGDKAETYLNLVTGMQFNRGYASPYFVTDVDTMTCTYEKAAVLLYDKKITNVNEILPVLQYVAKQKIPLVIVAEEVEGEALSTLVVNRIRGNIAVCAIKAPEYGQQRKYALEDLAQLLGCKVVSEDTGQKLENVADAMYFGIADKIIISRDSTTIIKKTPEAGFQDYVNSLKEQCKNAKNDYEAMKLQGRIAKLAGGIGVIKVGAVTEAAMKEKKDRVDDAFHATRAAIQEGVVPGGGIALLNVVNLIPEEFGTGGKLVQKAIKAPIQKMLDNAGLDPAVIINKIIGTDGGSVITEPWNVCGYDILNKTYTNMITAGIVDPAKVTRTALENAASIAGLLLTTECMIVDVKDDRPQLVMPNMGGGGMM
jgi:chaperonin GroEL